MKQLDLVIRNKTGLHARPARVFVDIAKQFQSNIRIGHGEKLVNAKSLISVLTLGVASGQRISIDVEGADEAAAVAALEAAVCRGLGEEPVVTTDDRRPTTDEPQTGDRRPETGENVALVSPGLMSPGLIQGIAGAPGIAIGPIHQFRRAEIVVRERAVGVAEEQARLQEALDEARAQLFTLRERLLLQTAALLHDIGVYVSLRGHHRHSQYILAASQIFGLSNEETAIVSNISRYHRRGLPQNSHLPFIALDRTDRLIVNKLAAILRVANALDAEHAQKVRDIRLVRRDSTWILEVDGTGDLTMEQLAATARADMFAQVFGRQLVIRLAGVTM